MRPFFILSSRPDVQYLSWKCSNDESLLVGQMQSAFRQILILARFGFFLVVQVCWNVNTKIPMHIRPVKISCGGIYWSCFVAKHLEMISLSVRADRLRFLPNGALFPLLCSKNDLCSCWVFSPSLQTCVHALKSFYINYITAFANGFMPYLHCYDYIIPKQKPHKSLFIVSIGSMCPCSADGMWPQLLPIQHLQHILLTFWCQWGHRPLYAGQFVVTHTARNCSHQLFT